jgi:hypothetical protein
MNKVDRVKRLKQNDELQNEKIVFIGEHFLYELILCYFRER